MHEASSLSKAIEQGWIKAGKPQEFTIRILEEPQKNFFVLTTKLAKIALFFEDIVTTPKQNVHYKGNAQKQKYERDELRSKEQLLRNKTSREQTSRMRFQTNEKIEKPVKNEPPREAVIAEPSLSKQRQPLWNEDMIHSTKEWLTKALHSIEKDSITFTIEPQRWHLRITLSMPIYADPQKEKHMLASLATILLETLKRQFKTGLRGHKIVLTHASNNNS